MAVSRQKHAAHGMKRKKEASLVQRVGNFLSGTRTIDNLANPTSAASVMQRKIRNSTVNNKPHGTTGRSSTGIGVGF